MKTMTALDAKNSFGKFLDAAQREPVTVTKNQREVGALFSMDDLSEMAVSFLADPIKADVENGKISVTDALMMQTKINQRLEASRKAYAEGKGIVADDAYFKRLRDIVKARIS